MIPVIIIAVVFTGLAATVFWAAPRGKLAPLSSVVMSTKKGTSLAINWSVGIIIVVFGFIVPAIFLIANHNDGATAGITGGIKLTSAEVQGRQVFGEHCAVCHTLSAASAVGKTGPNLDTLQGLSPSFIEYTIAHGCLADPTPAEAQAGETCLGEGSMPADVVQGKDADEVAEFVAKVAGHGDGT